MTNFLVWLMLVVVLLFQSRPGLEQLKRQVGRNHHHVEPWKELVEIVKDRWEKKEIPWEVEAPRLYDYKLVTIAVPKRDGVRYVGVLGNFVEYHDRDDILVIGCLHVIIYGMYYLFPGPTYKACNPSFERPWTLILSSFFVAHILAVIAFVSSVVNSGETLQSMIGRIPFLIVYIFPGFCLSIIQIVTRRWTKPVGGSPAMFAVLLHTVLLHPTKKYSLYGKEMSGFSLIVAQLSLPIVTALGNELRLFELIPEYLSGFTCGLVTFLFFNTEQAATMFRAYSIPLGAEKDPTSLILPLLGLNFLVCKACYERTQ